MNPALNKLLSDDFLVKYGFISTPTSLWRALKRSTYVTDIQNGLITGELSEDMIRAFVAAKLKELKTGEHFQYDLPMAAVATAIEHRSSEFADEYLTNLAKLKLAEMPMSIRVARECLKQRVNVARTKISTTDSKQPVHQTCMRYEDLALQFPRRERTAFLGRPEVRGKAVAV